MSCVPDIAAFIADWPGIVGEADSELALAVRERWGELTLAEIDQVAILVEQLIAARAASAGTDLQRLIEWTRLLYGTAMAAAMLYRHAVEPTFIGSSLPGRIAPGSPTDPPAQRCQI